MDYYALTLSAPERVSLSINSFTSLYVNLYDANNKQVWNKSCSPNGSTGDYSDSFELDLEEGSYYLEVKNWGDSTGAYYFRFDHEPDAEEPQEPAEEPVVISEAPEAAEEPETPEAAEEPETPATSAASQQNTAPAASEAEKGNANPEKSNENSPLLWIGVGLCVLAVIASAVTVFLVLKKKQHRGQG